MLRKRLRDAIWREFRFQSEFARHIGVTPAVVTNIIRGNRPFTVKRQEQWAAILKCKPEDLQD